MYCLLSAQVGNKQYNRRRPNQGHGSQNRIFYNDANTQVGTQIGPSGAFNNQPGGNYSQKIKINSIYVIKVCKSCHHFEFLDFNFYPKYISALIGNRRTNNNGMTMTTKNGVTTMTMNGMTLVVDAIDSG